MKLRSTILFLSFFLSIAQALWARELKLEDFRLLPHDISARTDMREDYNGDKCALIKISLPIEGCRFEGGVIASGFDVNEYRVHVAAGTKRLRIKCPGYQTLEIVFAEHSDISALESLCTYSMRIGGYEAMVGNEGKDPGINYLIMYIDPEDIPGLTVTVNGEIRQVEDGEVALCLPYGEYSYLVEAPGYRPEKGKVTVSKGEKGTVGIALQPTEVLHTENRNEDASPEEEPDNSGAHATLTLHSELAGALLKVNQRDRGTDDWSGTLAPGSYVIEAIKDGYRPYSETITLVNNEHRDFVIPELIPIFGAIDVSYRPAGASIVIDGSLFGETPAIINNIPVGYHTVTVNKKGYDSQVWSNVLVNEGEIYKISGSLEKSPVVIIEEDYTPPSYPGGMQAMWESMQRKLRIPADTPSGQHDISFELEIDEKGHLVEMRVVNPDSELNSLEEECKRLLKQLRPFNPAMRNGKPEKSMYTITFPIIVHNDMKGTRVL